MTLSSDNTAAPEVESSMASTSDASTLTNTGTKPDEINIKHKGGTDMKGGVAPSPSGFAVGCSWIVR